MDWTQENKLAARNQGWQLTESAGALRVVAFEAADVFFSEEAAQSFVERQAAEGDDLAKKALSMCRQQVPDVPLAQVLADVGAEVVELLAHADRDALERFDHRGVLTATIEFLPGFVSNLRNGVYADSGLLPEFYAPVPCPPAGWDTVVALVAKSRLRAPPQTFDAEDAPIPAYSRGAAFALEAVRARCPARGPSDGDEPIILKAARKAYQLALLVDKVPMPDDHLVGGGVLAMTKATIEGTARNLNDGLYIRTGVMPGITNPAYLPPQDWAKTVQAIRNEGLAQCPDLETDNEQYQFFEGVRWTLASYKRTFNDLSEPAVWPRLA